MEIRHTTPTASTTSPRGTTPESGEMRNQIIDWLRDAYAMERSMESGLKKQADNKNLSQSVRTRAAKHLEETKRHAEAVRSALQSLDTDTSALKTTMGITAQATKGMTTKFAQDEQVKDLLDAYMMEHFEIACYIALAAAAERAGFAQVADTCRRIIPEEERMAQALRESLPNEVVGYLFQTAKV